MGRVLGPAGKYEVVQCAAATYGSLKLFLVGATVMLSGCDPDSEVLGKQWPSSHYKLAAAVDTPEGVRTGHGVVEVA